MVDPDGLGPIIHPRTDQQKAGLHRVVVRDGETHGYERIDAEINDITLMALKAGAFDVGFTYACDIDDAGHVYGLRGDEYRAAIRRVDGLLGKLVHAVTERFERYGEDWLIVVTTDHGHLDDGGHGGTNPRERESWVIAWSPASAESLPSWPGDIPPHNLTPMILDARHREAA